MKRVPLFLISTLTFLGFANLYTAPANALVDHGKSYWTTDELEEFAAEIEPELEAACPSNSYPGCKNQYIFEKGQNDKIYRALQNYQSGRTVIKAFNPGNHTMRVYFRSVSSMNAEYGIDEHEDLKNIYIIRTDKNQSAGDIPQSIMEGNESVHIVYQGLASDHDNIEGWFPADVDVTLPVEDLSFPDSYQKTFVIHNDMGSYGDIDYWYYDDSVNLDEWTDGLEYQLVFDGNTRYYALTEARNDPIFGVEPEPTPEPEPTIEPETPETPETPDIVSGSGNGNESQGSETFVEQSSEAISDGIAVTPSTKNMASVASASNISSASKTEQGNTKEPSSSQASKKVEEPVMPLGGNLIDDLPTDTESSPEFPWWILIIVLAGTGTLIWRFIPARRD